MAKEGKAKVLTEDELKRVEVIAESGRQGLRDLCLIRFSFKLGLRVKEMASLKVSDVTDASGKVVNEFVLKNDQSKGDNGGRTVYLTSKVVRKDLQTYLDSREDDSPWLFKSQKTNFSPNSLQQLFARLYKRAGIKGAKSHSGRRTFATRLIERGADIKSVSLLMGHSNIQTTAKYIQGNPVKLGQMVAGL